MFQMKKMYGNVSNERYVNSGLEIVTQWLPKIEHGRLNF